MSLTATDPFTRHIKSLTQRKQALVTIETQRIGAAGCKSLGNSVFSPKALPSGCPNTPLLEACRLCPTFPRATSRECSREVALDVLPVHSQHLAAGLALSCLWSERGFEEMAGDFSPRTSLVRLPLSTGSRLSAPMADPAARPRCLPQAGPRCPALGAAPTAQQQPGQGFRQLSSPRPSAARCHSFPSLKYVFYYKLFHLMNNIPTALSRV